MSGIYGVIGDARLEELTPMAERLRHRGATGGEWDVSPTIRFGQRRRGTPGEVFTAPSVPVAFDGFIDNRPELLQLLAGRGADYCDDASLIFALYRRFGTEGFRYLRGQFGLALIDPATGALMLARDRWGTRSIYFARHQGCIVFASEYKALLAFREFPPRPNLEAIQYVQCTLHGHPKACFLAGVEVVPAAGWITFRDGEALAGRFWEPTLHILARPEEEHAASVRGCFLEALREQTSGKPALGVALSGGLDSALVVGGLHQVAPDTPIHTFTAGFGEGDPEMMGAAQVARHFGTIHHEVLMPPERLPEVLRPMVWHIEDTVGHEEVAYLYITTREATKYVDTLFSGRKADMLFAGMPRHKLIKLAIVLPMFRGGLREFYNFTQTGREPASLLGKALVGAYYRGTEIPPAHVIGVSDYPPPDPLPLDAAQPLNEKLRRDIFDEPVTMTATERLHGAFALHSNSPFMDYRMFDCAFQVPDRLKVHGLRQKHILRVACRGLLPEGVLDRKKSLQRLKHDQILSDVLERLAAEILSPAAVASRGFFTPQHVERVRRRPAGASYPSIQIYRLWSLLLAELWAQLFLDRRGAPIGAA
jgi:asparagine synthase (glutamine-hydrolysing)